MIAPYNNVILNDFTAWEVILTLFWTGGGANLPPSWFFEYSSETVRSRKLKLCDF